MKMKTKLIHEHMHDTVRLAQISEEHQRVKRTHGLARRTAIQVQSGNDIATSYTRQHNFLVVIIVDESHNGVFNCCDCDKDPLVDPPRGGTQNGGHVSTRNGPSKRCLPIVLEMGAVPKTGAIFRAETGAANDEPRNGCRKR